MKDRNRLTDVENRLLVAKGEVGAEKCGVMEWKFGVSRCKLLDMNGWTTRSYCIA